jgi:hypothetical protein
MSTHTLAFSTPELTLMRFAFWLGDSVPDPKNEGKGFPRMMTFLTEQDYEPVLIFCSECGTTLSATAKFCPECGTTQE